MDYEATYRLLSRILADPTRYYRFPTNVHVAVRQCAQAEKNTSNFSVAGTTSFMLAVAVSLVGYKTLTLWLIGAAVIFASLVVFSQMRFERLKATLDSIFNDYLDLCNRLEVPSTSFAELPDYVQDISIRNYLFRLGERVAEARRALTVASADNLVAAEKEFADTYHKCVDIGLIVDRGIDLYMPSNSASSTVH